MKRNHLPEIKQELALLQNQFLLLFLKYKLGFRCSEEALQALPLVTQENKHLLTHCFFHAVLGNSTPENPQVKVGLKKVGERFFLEIWSSGQASRFHQAFEEYCDDLLLMRFLKLHQLNHSFSKLEKEQLEVEPDELGCGSKIRLLLN